MCALVFAFARGRKPVGRVLRGRRLLRKADQDLIVEGRELFVSRRRVGCSRRHAAGSRVLKYFSDGIRDANGPRRSCGWRLRAGRVMLLPLPKPASFQTKPLITFRPKFHASSRPGLSPMSAPSHSLVIHDSARNDVKGLLLCLSFR